MRAGFLNKRAFPLKQSRYSPFSNHTASTMQTHPISNDSILTALNWRYATKKFDPTRKISPADWQVLEQALVLSPSSFGLQPWKFLVITDQAIKEALVPFSWGQQQVADCSHLVVFSHRKEITPEYLDRFLQRIVEVRGVPLESLSGYRSLMAEKIFKGPLRNQIGEWNRLQAYIAFGSLLTCAAMMGIDTCPMEGLEPAKYDEILNLEERGLTTSAACPVGYRAADDPYATYPKVRFETKDLVEYI